MLMKKMTANETESDVPEVSRQFFSKNFKDPISPFSQPYGASSLRMIAISIRAFSG
jgi:hypothetical protein